MRTIQALLSKQSDSGGRHGRRAQTPGTTRFLDLEIEGDENNFVERTIRIASSRPARRRPSERR